MMFKLSLVLVAICSFLTGRAFGEGPADTTRSRPKWYVPHYLPLQFAGNIGFLSTGVGYRFSEGRYELNVLYGYVPASVGEIEIHMVTARSIFPLMHMPIRNDQEIIPYCGLGLSVEVSGHAFFTLPSRFPDDYYHFPKNLHVTAFGGVKLQQLFADDVLFLKGMEVYAQAGTIDAYIWYRFISKEIRLNQIFSLALGVNLVLRD